MCVFLQSGLLFNMTVFVTWCPMCVFLQSGLRVLRRPADAAEGRPQQLARLWGWLPCLPHDEETGLLTPAVVAAIFLAILPCTLRWSSSCLEGCWNWLSVYVITACVCVCVFVTVSMCVWCMAVRTGSWLCIKIQLGCVCVCVRNVFNLRGMFWDKLNATTVKMLLAGAMYNI